MVTEEWRKSEVKMASIFQGETMENFDLEKYNVAKISDLKVRTISKDILLDQYISMFWKSTLKLHSRKDLENFLTYLLKIDHLETRMSICQTN